jgi:hypothetical protein
VDEDGLEDAFELVAEVPEKIRCGGNSRKPNKTMTPDYLW